MTQETIFSMNTTFRGDYCIKGYHFGKGERAACIVGAMRGNEFQQLYICTKLIAKLKELEEKGAIVAGKEIFLIPTLNHGSMNVGKKYWVSDNSDLNRAFPGNADGQATSRIADAVLKKVTGYQYGIQFASFYLEGEFIPHVRMMETGHQSTSLANLFGLPYVVTSTPRAFDHATLNYNWQMNGTDAFSIYTGVTEQIDDDKASMAVSAVMRFLTRMGIIRYQCHGGYISSILEEDDLVSIKSNTPGFLNTMIGTNREVKRGEVLAQIIDPCFGNISSEIIAPTDGIVFFMQKSPMVFQNSVIYRMIKRIHA